MMVGFMKIWNRVHGIKLAFGNENSERICYVRLKGPSVDLNHSYIHTLYLTPNIVTSHWGFKILNIPG